MAKKTVIFIFVLSILAALLAGINIGQKIERFQPETIPSPSAINSTPTLKVLPTMTPVALPSGKSTYTSRSCGFSFSYPGTYLSQKSVNEQSVILTDPDDPTASITTACDKEIPEPPLPPEKIEAITLDGIDATLYHDANAKDGSPRDEVIVKHPTNGKEIIIAGFGPSFQSALSSFKFVQ